MQIRFLLPLAALPLAGSASAQMWLDDFDSYASGTALEGQGGWHGWGGTNTTFATVTNVIAHSGTNSLELNSGGDTVHEYGPFSSGRWEYTAYIFLEAEDMALPGFGLHALKGKLKAHHAVSVSGNWRVTFRFERGDARDVDYTDYH